MPGAARVMAVGAALAWALWFAWTLTPWLPIARVLPLDTVVALPAALLLTAGAILLAAGSRRGPASHDADRLRRQAMRAGAASLAMWLFVAMAFLVPLPGVGAMTLPALTGAILFAALARSASKEARAAGDPPRAVHVVTSAVSAIGLAAALVLLLGMLVLLWLLRDSTF